MKSKFFIAIAVCISLATSEVNVYAGATGACYGSFPNLITDICYDCMFPISVGGIALNFGVNSSDYDTGVGTSPVCICAQNLAVGTPMAFWEPHYMVDSTNTPGCMPLLAGININTPYNADEYGGDVETDKPLHSRTKAAFMHVNEYINPVMTTLGIISQSPCFDSRSFDVPYMSWADPTWNDDDLAMILTPYAYPFSGVLSIASEMPDGIAATAGFPLEELFWVAGSWGAMYPLTGHVGAVNSQAQVSHLLYTRLFAKLHAAGTQMETAGTEALQSCGATGLPNLIMDKRQYKFNRTFPFPDNMCTPVGRPLVVEEIGANRPQDKDFGDFVFQRKDCCQPLN